MEWESYINFIITNYRKYYPHSKLTGILIVLGETPITERLEDEAKMRDRLIKLASVNCLTVHFSLRKRQGNHWVDKGVDCFIASNILLGAFENHYDHCIVVSDDTDFVPVASLITDHFGKKFIHAGYKRELGIKSYFSIDLNLLKNKR